MAVEECASESASLRCAQVHSHSYSFSFHHCIVNSGLRDRDFGLSFHLPAEHLAASLARHERVSHGCSGTRAHAGLECLREIVGWRNWGAHLGHRVVAWSSRIARGLGQVEVTRGGQRGGREAGGVGCGGHGKVTVCG